MHRPQKLTLANLPTPLFHHAALDRLVGTEVWVKRDDMTGGAETGNKIRKLEYLLLDAQQHNATTVITCGGLQSNHCRATAVAARQLGLDPVLLLRSSASTSPAAAEGGNVLLDRLLGAEIHRVTPDQYADRDRLMAELAESLRRAGRQPYIIPEGGSNGLGALGYVDAMSELSAQLGPVPADRAYHFDAIVHACGSGGTAAGTALGAKSQGIAPQVLAMAVCDDSAYFETRIQEIMADAVGLLPALAEVPAADLVLHDEFKGPTYGVASPAQLSFIREVARVSGLLLDPVYSGKALHGLSELGSRPARVCFIHTGGLPGLLADREVMSHPFGTEGTAHA